jgi:CheY-like chemotaxis protein
MKPRKVVLVDDEQDVRFYLETALEDAGYLPLAASNVHEGLELIKKEKPDLICLDILMPEESGLSLLQKLRCDRSLASIPVIITSALSVSKELSDVDYLALPDGTEIAEPEGYLEKPISAERLLAEVEAVLEADDADRD